MIRGFWFAAGAGVGVYAVLKARRTAEAFTPEGLHDRLAGLAVGVSLFNEEVRAGMSEKETELRERLGLTLDGSIGSRALPSPPAVPRATIPTTHRESM